MQALAQPLPSHYRRLFTIIPTPEVAVIVIIRRRNWRISSHFNQKLIAALIARSIPSQDEHRSAR